MNALSEGDIPLISARKFNNGCKSFVELTGMKKGLFPGNTISLNNDGQGGAGLAFYQPYMMALDSHCTCLTGKKNLNKWVLLYISECLSKQESKFGHGYAISDNRIKKYSFLLPINKDGKPDFVYMENYTKSIVIKKYREYLQVASKV